jgi:hypothetical protein
MKFMTRDQRLVSRDTNNKKLGTRDGTQVTDLLTALYLKTRAEPFSGSALDKIVI